MIFSKLPTRHASYESAVQAEMSQYEGIAVQDEPVRRSVAPCDLIFNPPICRPAVLCHRGESGATSTPFLNMKQPHPRNSPVMITQ